MQYLCIFSAEVVMRFIDILKLRPANEVAVVVARIADIWC